MSKKKKVIVLSTMIALLVTTAVLNFVLSSSISGNGKVDAVTTANYFTEIKSTRNTSRSKQLEQIDEVIATSADGSEAKNDALAVKLKLAQITEKENLLENLIKAKGYEEVAVTIGMTSDNV
ncbi:MAG: SpoIIIAH-like family protein, partial [Clostridia bacterium]|nr:SpoIIIAH-like family protein [Clostridia bacterium]